MKLTIEATDPAEIQQLAFYLSGVKPSDGLNEAVVHENAQAPASEPETPVVNSTQKATGKRGRPPKKDNSTTEVSTVTSSTDASQDTPPVTSPADVGVEYESAEITTVEEVRAALIQLADAKGVKAATDLAEKYASSRKAQDVPEDKRAELISEAKRQLGSNE